MVLALIMSAFSCGRLPEVTPGKAGVPSDPPTTLAPTTSSESSKAPPEAPPPECRVIYGKPPPGYDTGRRDVVRGDTGEIIATANPGEPLPAGWEHCR